MGFSFCFKGFEAGALEAVSEGLQPMETPSMAITIQPTVRIVLFLSALACFRCVAFW
jgi:hypothetical protein